MNIRIFALMTAALLLIACAASPGRVRQAGPVPAIDVVHGQAMEGYDPVAYFELQRPVKGRAEFSHHWQGAEWRFDSAHHRDLFIASPDAYAPRYGSYCAFAVSRGTTAHGDPNVWRIVDSGLYLNNNRFAQELWEKDIPGNIAAADQNWPLLPKREMTTQTDR
jgi:hypothetical protein